MGEASSKLVWRLGVVFLVSIVSWSTVRYPYTKVEESFTVQAVHDILAYGLSKDALQHYDHQVFPGAVPRSFIGPLVLAAASCPWIVVARYFDIVKTSADVQVVVRLVLGLSNALSLVFLSKSCFKPCTRQIAQEDVPLSIIFDSGRSTSVKPNMTTTTSRKAGTPQNVGTWKHEDGNTSPEDSKLPSSGDLEAGLFLLISASQFHLTFWNSRTIPNSVAFPFVMVSLALILRHLGPERTTAMAKRDFRTAISLLTFSAVVLRSEIVAMIAPAGLYLLFTRKLGLVQGVAAGIHAFIFSVLATISVDTYFWQDLTQAEARNIAQVFLQSVSALARGKGRPLWPELEAALFNVVEGKSSEWGVEPWHAYLSSHLPKLLGLILPLLLVGLVQVFRLPKKSALLWRTAFLGTVGLGQVATLSLLEHKEWRFVIYCLPCYNALAVVGASRLAFSKIASLALIALLSLQTAMSFFRAHISGLNYPGGEAMSQFHRWAQDNPNKAANVHLHIDVLPAMTGVTLFQSVHLRRISTNATRFSALPIAIPESTVPSFRWTYDKTENLPLHGAGAAKAWGEYTHLLSEHADCKVLRTVPDPSSGESEVLAKSEQPFESIGEPVLTYEGIRLKSLHDYKSSLQSLRKTLPQQGSEVSKFGAWCYHAIGLAIDTLLPVSIRRRPAIWICRQKASA